MSEKSKDVGITPKLTWNKLYKKLAKWALFTVLTLSSCNWNNGTEIVKDINNNNIPSSYVNKDNKGGLEENTIQYADSLRNIANNSFDDLDYAEALKDYLIAYDIYDKKSDHDNAWKVAIDIARTYLNQKENERAFNYYNESLANLDKIWYAAGILIVYKEILLNNFDKSDDAIFEKYSNMWINLYKNLEDNQKDEKTKSKYIKFLITNIEYLIDKDAPETEISEVFNEIKGIVWYDFSLVKDEKIKTKLNILSWQLYFKQWDYSKALKRFEWIDIGSVNDISVQKDLFYLKYKTYEKVWDSKNALKYHVMRDNLDRDITNKDKQEELTRLAIKYETEKKDMEIKTQKIELDAKEEKIKSWKQRQVGLIIISAISALFAGWVEVFRRKIKISKEIAENLRFTAEIEKMKSDHRKDIAEKAEQEAMKQKIIAEDAKTQVEEKNEEIETKNDELNTKNIDLNQKNIEIEKQKTIIEKSKEDIESGIRYSSRIQRAILPTKEAMGETFPDNFIFFKPRDIVSGDFYWTKKINWRNFFAQVDCTGHGVPWAFVSLVSHNWLENAVNAGNETPADILNYLDKYIASQLVKEENTEWIKDGMDMFLYSYDIKTWKLTYAGNQSEMLLVPDDKNFVLEKLTNRGKRIEITPNDNELVIGYTIRWDSVNFWSDNEDLKKKSKYTEIWSVKSLDDKWDQNHLVLTDYKKWIDKHIEKTKLEQLYNNIVSYKNDEWETVEWEIVLNTKNGNVAEKWWIMIRWQNGNIFGMPKKNLQRKSDLSIIFFAVGSKISYTNSSGVEIKWEIVKNNENIIYIKQSNWKVTKRDKWNLYNNKTLKLDHTQNNEFLKYRSIFWINKRITWKEKFENTTIEIDGATLYSYSDWFPDQFGKHNPKQVKDRKFLFKRFRELLMKNKYKPLNKQKEILEIVLEKYQRDLWQTDDISVTAVRLEKEKEKNK